MEKTINFMKWVTVSPDTSLLLTQTDTDPNFISISPWHNSFGNGVTTIDKDTAIKLANVLLDWAGGGNK
jgi:hypothetical protein